MIPWVNDTDPDWLKEFIKYSDDGYGLRDDIKKLYRDYGFLKYWFRGVEKFAPYVRKIHFVTNGQLPDWLNIDNPKLNWVKHEDYIPLDYLPVFSSHPIELYMHKIPDLAEHFVYFNDDIYLISKTEPDFFFKKGLPCDYAISNIQKPERTIMRRIVMNNLAEINQHFNKINYVKKFPFKHLNFRYGKTNIRTLACLLWPETTGFQNYHLAQPYLKSTLEEVWKKCENILKDTMNNKFRNGNDVNQWLFRYWQLCKGSFFPINPKKHRKYFELDMEINDICSALLSKKYKEVVLNDSICKDYNERINIISDVLNKILPDKSGFEK